MNIVELIHEKYIKKKRVINLGKVITSILPNNITLLDLGGGDGSIAKFVKLKRSDVDITCMDVNKSKNDKMPVKVYDGETIPCTSSSFDCVMLIDVLHHTRSPNKVLYEAQRVAKKYILVKDQKCDGFGSNSILKFMDSVGNKRYGVSLPYNYMTNIEWEKSFNKLDLIKCLFIHRNLNFTF